VLWRLPASANQIAKIVWLAQSEPLLNKRANTSWRLQPEAMAVLAPFAGSLVPVRTAAPWSLSVFYSS